MLRVASWNLWWRFGPWWPRQPAIASTLAGLGADVVGLQEVWAEAGGANQAQILAERLGYEWFTGDLTFRDDVAFTNAILSRWPIEDAGVVPLPGIEGRPAARRLLWARIVAPFGPLLFFTTHLDWPFDASALRLAQVRAICDEVARRREAPASGYPAVLTGDFNAVPDSDEVRALTGASAPPVPGLVFTDAWAAAGNAGPGWTWDGANPYLAEASWPNRRIDYVFVSWPRPKPAGSVLDCRLAGLEPIEGVVPSDHLAVVVDLRTR